MSYLYPMAQPSFDLSVLNEDWTLFLDRDGVINVKRPGYISAKEDFHFTEDAVDSIVAMNEFFFRTFVVTNQQGISKGILTHEELGRVHDHMLEAIDSKGGFVDKIYYCGDLSGTGSVNRKPATGMGLQAKADFPDIDFNKSIMLGDSHTDMQFARNLGMIAVFISSDDVCAQAHLVVPSLASFWRLVRQATTN